MKKVLVLLTLLITGFLGNSQDYDWGIGGRFSKFGLGATGKYFFQPDKAAELIATNISGVIYTGGLLTGLYEIHKPFHARTLSITSMSWYYGFGAHVGTFSDVGLSTGFSSFGVNGVIGLEYIIEQAPISLTLDVMPTWSSSERFYNTNLLDISFSIRYIMK